MTWKAGDRFAADHLTGVVRQIQSVKVSAYVYEPVSYTVKVDDWPFEFVIPPWVMERCSKVEDAD